jgi:hypothetical protein
VRKNCRRDVMPVDVIIHYFSTLFVNSLLQKSCGDIVCRNNVFICPVDNDVGMFSSKNYVLFKWGDVKSSIFWDITTCSYVQFCLMPDPCLFLILLLFDLKMEAVYIAEMSFDSLDARRYVKDCLQWLRLQ